MTRSGRNQRAARMAKAASCSSRMEYLPAVSRARRTMGVTRVSGSMRRIFFRTLTSCLLLRASVMPVTEKGAEPLAKNRLRRANSEKTGNRVEGKRENDGIEAKRQYAMEQHQPPHFARRH